MTTHDATGDAGSSTERKIKAEAAAPSSDIVQELAETKGALMAATATIEMLRKERLGLLYTMRNEMVALRAQVDTLRPAAIAYETVRAILALSAPKTGGGEMTQDTLWHVNNEINRIENEAKLAAMAAKPEPSADV